MPPHLRCHHVVSGVGEWARVTGGRDLYGGFVASWGVSFGFVYLNVIYGKVMKHYLIMGGVAYEGIDTQGRGVLKVASWE